MQPIIIMMSKEELARRTCIGEQHTFQYHALTILPYHHLSCTMTNDIARHSVYSVAVLVLAYVEYCRETCTPEACFNRWCFVFLFLFFAFLFPFFLLAVSATDGMREMSCTCICSNAVNLSIVSHFNFI